MPQEVISPVSGDEETVLQILEQGGSVAPIGRWKSPVESLVSKGLVRMDDPVNCSITSAGASALKVEDDSMWEAMAKQVMVLGRSKAEIQILGEQAAELLVRIARASTAATGNSESSEVTKWGNVIIDKAQDLLCSK